jgi:hypothetical protein
MKRDFAGGLWCPPQTVPAPWLGAPIKGRSLPKRPLAVKGMVRGQMSKKSSYGKSSGLRLPHQLGERPDAVRSCRYRFCPISGSKQT